MTSGFIIFPVFSWFGLSGTHVVLTSTAPKGAGPQIAVRGFITLANETDLMKDGPSPSSATQSTWQIILIVFGSVAGLVVLFTALCYVNNSRSRPLWMQNILKVRACAFYHHLLTPCKHQYIFLVLFYLQATSSQPSRSNSDHSVSIEIVTPGGVALASSLDCSSDESAITSDKHRISQGNSISVGQPPLPGDIPLVSPREEELSPSLWKVESAKEMALALLGPIHRGHTLEEPRPDTQHLMDDIFSSVHDEHW